jgi:protein SCO1
LRDECPRQQAQLERSLHKRELVALVGLVAVAGVISALVIPSKSAAPLLPGNATSSHTSRFAGATLSPVDPAPPLALHNYLGDKVDIRQYGGHPVLVTFLYTHCPDVCPLTAANLRAALVQMPAPEARRLRIVAVSVDPRGDTRASVASFLQMHDLGGRMKYLIGSAPTLARVWAAWRIGAQTESATPERVAHAALIYGISASGKLTTVYPANVKPADLASDIPRLADS